MMHPINQAIKICFLLSVLNAAFFIFPAMSLAASTLQYSWNMDANPGWSTQGLWAWGQPKGEGGSYNGIPDPTSGYTGTNVYGYNLLGDYENNLLEKHLTSTAIDCSGLTQVTLKFRRWLGVEEGMWGEHAYVRVSNDGNTWTTADDHPAYWVNPEDVEVADESWSLQELNISSIADGRPTVYLRWTMGPTDDQYQYCGWNIDDVEIWAVTSAAPPAATTGSAVSTSSSSATLNGTVNPNGASTSVVFNYGRTTGYGSTATASQSPLSGTSAQAVNVGISGLGQGLTYHYRVVATNSAGTTYGSDRTFTTLSCPDCSGPIVENVTFPANKNCECISSTSIPMGTGITFETGANVTVKAPTVILKPGFRAPSNARLNIRQP